MCLFVPLPQRSDGHIDALSSSLKEPHSVRCCIDIAKDPDPEAEADTDTDSDMGTEIEAEPGPKPEPEPEPEPEPGLGTRARAETEAEAGAGAEAEAEAGEEWPGGPVSVRNLWMMALRLLPQH